MKIDRQALQQAAEHMRLGQHCALGDHDNTHCQFCGAEIPDRHRRIILGYQDAVRVFCMACCNNWSTSLPIGPSTPALMVLRLLDDDAPA